MFGKASLDIPSSGDIGHSRHVGLSDELAMIYGRIAALTLSEQDGYVIVTLSDEHEKVIGYDTVSDNIRIGDLQ